MELKIKIISPYSFIITIFFSLFMLNDLFNVQSLGYADEITGILSFVGIIITILLTISKKIKMNTNIVIIILLLLAMELFGFAGNIFNGLNINLSTIVTESFIFVKQYLFFIFLFISLTPRFAKEIFYCLTFISKLMILVLCFLAIINAIFDIGMSAQDNAFQFISIFPGAVSIWGLIFTSIILFSDTKYKLAYTIMSSIIIILTKSGLGILGLGLIAIIYIFIVKQKKFRWYYSVIAVPVILLLSYNEINTYLLDDTAPRAILFQYSFVTAFNFFPLGAGFATYGSTLAAQNYSPLYIQYGFDKIWGLSPQFPMFLMDSYYPRIVGEFGIFGLLIFVVIIFVIIFKMILTINNVYRKGYSLMLFLIVCAAGLGFNTGGAGGCALYIVLGLMLYIGNHKEFDNIRLS